MASKANQRCDRGARGQGNRERGRIEPLQSTRRVFEGVVRRGTARERTCEPISRLGGSHAQLAAYERATVANCRRLGLSCAACGHRSSTRSVAGELVKVLKLMRAVFP